MTDPTSDTDPQIARAAGDPLGEILHLLRLTGSFYCQSRLTSPWGIAVPALGDVLTFAVVTGGQCWLTAGGETPLRLDTGTLVLLTGGGAHRFASGPGVGATALDDLPVRRFSRTFETLDFGGGGAETRLMYGVVRIDHAAGTMLMDLMPPVLKIDSWRDEAGAWLHGTLQFIAREAGDLRPGGEAVITRLSDVVVIEAIRRWIDTAPEADSGWLKGARDPQIGHAIMAVHRDPARPWTLDGLARVAGMSRSAFSARFTETVGMAAIHYVTHWRMQLARSRLINTPQSVASIAFDLGYRSEPAFSRAFKRVFGQPPARVRRTG